VTPTDRPSKQEAFLAFLKDGWVTVYIDARRPGVAVPDHLRAETRLVLQYGLNMPVPVEDLEVTDEGVKATLSFSRTPWQTMIPWSAIYVIACTDGRGVLFQEDVPPELMSSFVGGEEAPDSEDAEESQPLPRKPVAAVAALAATEELESQSPPEQALPPPRARLKSVPMTSAPAEPTDEARSKETVGDNDPPEAPRGRPTLTIVKS
jgi:stringent starvation protein B